MRILPFGVLLFGVYAGSLSAQTMPGPVELAEAQGVCAPFGVASATIDPEGVIQAICNEDATAFVPLLGGLGPVLGLGAATAVAAAVAGGNTTPDTR